MPRKNALTGARFLCTWSSMPWPIVVFTALAWESAAVRSVLHQVRREREGVWRGSSGRRDVVIVTGGIGPHRARQTVEEFADTPLSAVLSVGCAGALIPGLTTGQLVLAPAVRMYAEEMAGQLDTFVVDKRLLSAAQNAAQQAGIETREGGIVTSPRVLFYPARKKKREDERQIVLPLRWKVAYTLPLPRNAKLPFFSPYALFLIRLIWLFHL